MGTVSGKPEWITEDARGSWHGMRMTHKPGHSLVLIRVVHIWWHWNRLPQAQNVWKSIHIFDYYDGISKMRLAHESFTEFKTLKDALKDEDR